MITISNNRRIFSGFYKKHDNSRIYAVKEVKDIDSGEKMVICYHFTYSDKREYFTITKKSFCEYIEIDGEKVLKYTREPKGKASSFDVNKLTEDGFEGPVRKKEKSPDEAYEHRDYQNQYSYYNYAKDICENFSVDIRKYKLCVEQKRYIGMLTKNSFEKMKEDIEFTNFLLKTSLNEYETFFKDRFIKKMSIRKLADIYKTNRGSIEFTQKKFYTGFAVSLQERDINDNKIRIVKQGK